MAHGVLQGVPGGVQRWDIGGDVYLAYMVPGTSPPVPMLFHVERIEQLGELYEGAPEAPDRVLTREEANQLGVIIGGASSELSSNLGENPWDGFLAKIARRVPTEPWLDEPEVIAELGAAWLRGDPEPNIRATEWYQSKTPGQREWIALQAGDPAAAESRRKDNRDRVRNALVAAGVDEPTDRFVDYLADQWTQGDMTADELKEQIRKEADPFADGASPFAGFLLPEETEFVRDKEGRLYADTGDGSFWRLTGTGQEAKYVRDPDKVTLVDSVEESGTLADLAAKTPVHGGTVSGLGGAEEVRVLLKRYLGPALAQGYSNEWIEEWASKIRANPNADEQLKDLLQHRFWAMYPRYQQQDMVYEDVAGSLKGWAANRYVVGEIDETSDWFQGLLDIEDPLERARFMRERGRREGWTGAEFEQFEQGADARLGGRVIRPVGV